MNKHELLKEFYSKGLDRPYNKMIVKKRPELLTTLKEYTTFLCDDVTISERLYCLKNDLEPNVCECGIVAIFKSPKEGYSEFCSRKCASSSNKTKERRKKTTIESQGGLGFASKKITDKVKETNLKKFGFENATQSKEIANKISKTWETVNKENVLKKRKETNLKKYGTEHHQQNPEQKEKIKNGLIEKQDGIGFASKKIANKVKETNLKKFGFENAMQNSGVQEKLKETIQEKFGVSNISEHGNELWNKFKDEFNPDTFKITESLKEMEEKYGVRYYTISDFLQRFGYKFSTISSYEQSLRHFLPNDFKYNDRTVLSGKELDFYSEKRRLAIEFNGLLYHSEKYGKNMNYHNEKTNMTLQKNIQLIHIFENEYVYKKPIVESIINSKLGKFKERLYARNCEIKEIDVKTKNDFLEENHLQGKDNSLIKFGLFYNMELVSVMTFGHSRFNKNYQYEMHRFCNKMGYQIIGGASKLWTNFLKKYTPISVITYADRRYSNGTFYRKIGFDLKNISKPNFFVFGNSIKGLDSRLKWQKHKLKNKLDNFDPDLSAWDNMRNHGYNRIWDCGNYVFEWKK